MNAQFKKRLESFLWRTSMMVLAFLTTAILDNIELIDYNPIIVLALGLVLGEVSKFLNSELRR